MLPQSEVAQDVQDVFTQDVTEEEVVTPDTPSDENETTVESEVVEDNAQTHAEGNGTENPTVYAGKYNSIEELQQGFASLGGDPKRYKDAHQLEEAYLTRFREFTRVRQEQAELERIAQQSESTPRAAGDPRADDAEALLAKVDWTKVETAQDLGRELLTVVKQMMPQQATQPSEADLVNRMMPIIQQREAASREITELEAKVPRLRQNDDGSPNPFRDAFANHVASEKSRGDYVNLTESMKAFLAWTADIASQRDKVFGERQASKSGSSIGTDRQVMPTSQGDEVDDIIASHSERQKRLGLA